MSVNTPALLTSVTAISWTTDSPNIQTSLAVVNLLKLIDSGAIHLMGSLPLEAEFKNKV